MMLWDQHIYLPDDNLAKVDRASMAVSLEVRVPILDHEVVEFSWSLPTDWLVRGDEKKVILRNLLYRYVPRSTVDRPKVGFTPPLGPWLRGSLRDWGSQLLSESRLARDGLFSAEVAGREWDQFLSHREDKAFAVWALCQFQSWADRWHPTGVPL